MRPTSEIKKVIWALDAFPEDRNLDRAAARAMRSILKSAQPQILPVYVLVPDEIDRLSLAMNDFWQTQYREGATKALHSFIAKTKLPNLKPPAIINNPRGTLRGGVEALNDYAKSAGADLIVLSTHGRKGLARMFLGSFAESLLMRSDVPVLVINPQMAPVRSVRRVLFPTDLSDLSRNAFEHVVRWAAEEKAELTLFHLVPDQLRFIAGTGLMLADGVYYSTADVLKREYEARHERAEEWAEWARTNHGIQATAVVRRSKGDIARDLLAYAKRTKPSLIAMSSDKGPATTIVLGSSSRKVIRGALCPVWVFHSRGEQEISSGTGPGPGLTTRGTPKTSDRRETPRTKSADARNLVLPPTLLI